jgi:16S rRNA (cytosine1402-N4)-methyltransferase
LKKNGIILLITFHSGEDRIVKNKFKQLAQDGLGEIMTKKPVVPSRQECLANPPSRSAKLRVLRRV